MFYKIIITLVLIYSTSLSQTLYETIITPLDGNEQDFFGVETKIIGNELIIGANKYDYLQQNNGAIYIYEFNGSNWDFNEIIVSPSNRQGAHFGISMAVDDSLIFVGATRDTSEGLATGSVYLYKKINKNWELEEKIVPLGTNTLALFGSSISMKMNSLLIGAPQDNGIVPLSGAAYLFEKIGSNWIQKDKIIGEDALQNYIFGSSVAIFGDYLFVGAPSATDLGSNSGAVYLYKIKNDSVHFVTKFIGSSVSAEYLFGTEISADSNRVAIGAVGSLGAQNYKGSVYIYELEGNQWIEKNQIIPDDPSAYHFGSSVELKGDTLLIGALGHIEIGGKGIGYLYIKSQNEWKQVQSFKASDGNNANFFGDASDMQNGFIVFGAVGQDIFGTNSGAAYVYSEHPTGIDDLNPPVLDDFILYQNYPNPFNPVTIIKYEIPGQARNDNMKVQLKVYDVLGTEIATLVNEEKPAGIYEVEFDATGLPSGIYIYRLTVGSHSASSGRGFTASQKLILLK